MTPLGTWVLFRRRGHPSTARTRFSRQGRDARCSGLATCWRSHDSLRKWGEIV